MKKIVVINGPGRSGKGTFIKMVRLILSSTDIGVYSFSSIFPIKEKMVADGIWDGKSEKTTEIRSRMVQIKQDMTLNGDIPNKYLFRSINQVDDPSIIFVHIREASAINSFENMFKDKIYKLHLERTDDTMESFESGVDLTSQTREYDSYDYDIVIKEFGLEKMKRDVNEFLKDFLRNESYLLEDFDIEDLDLDFLHKRYNDEMKAGYL